PSFMFFQFLLRPPPSATLFPTRRSSDLRARLRAQPGEQPTKQRGISEPCLVFLWPQRVRRGPRRTRCGQKKTRHGSEMPRCFVGDRKSTRLNSSQLVTSYAVFCLKKKKK